MRVADIAGLAEVAHEAGVPLAVDHTFAPLLSRPLALGADLVVHSATKLIGGHSDVTLGLVVGRKAVIDRLANLASTFGLTGNPFDSWLALRGLATLALRVRQTSINALELAGRLERASGRGLGPLSRACRPTPTTPSRAGSSPTASAR